MPTINFFESIYNNQLGIPYVQEIGQIESGCFKNP